MTPSWHSYQLADEKASELNDIIWKQAMYAMEHYLLPKLLVLGKETAARHYGSTKASLFRVEFFEIPIKYVDGEFVYLVGYDPRVSE